MRFEAFTTYTLLFAAFCPNLIFRNVFKIPADSPMFLSFFGIKSGSPWTARPCVFAFVCACVCVCACECVFTDEAWRRRRFIHQSDENRSLLLVY